MTTNSAGGDRPRALHKYQGSSETRVGSSDQAGGPNWPQTVLLLGLVVATFAFTIILFKAGVPIAGAAGIAIGTVLLLVVAVLPGIKGAAVRRMAHALVEAGDQR